ncbi:MAG: 2-hydroxyacyl-CoA dehydratase family protein [Oscillospiraceae bacterium]|nr:2-hydroxyacyl-CoA dehydratase family protein [Oscillospiraceae bacterium]
MYDLPEQFSAFGEARQKGFLTVKSVKEAGGMVAGVFCTFTPLEILDAAGFLPVSLCGMSDEVIPAAEAHLPRNLCPLIKSSYGFAVSQKCPYTYFADLIVGETTCDGKKKMYELLGKLKRTYILHLPQGEDPNALESWTKELRRFIAYLEDTFSLRITDEALREAAHMRNRERQKRMRLMELMKLDPPPMRGEQLASVLDGAGFLFEAASREAKLDSLAEEVSTQYVAGERPVSASDKRILVTGCPIGGVLKKAVGLIERSGGTAVCFENCSGIKAAWQMVDADAPDIVRAIAARYLEIGCAVMTPNAKRFALLERLVDEYRIDGVVEVELQFCTPYLIEAHPVREWARGRELPYLGLETDYSQSDAGQLSTRLEAFLERL